MTTQVTVNKLFYVKVDATTITGEAANFTYDIIDLATNTPSSGTSLFTEVVAGFYTLPLTLLTSGDYVIVVKHNMMVAKRIPISVTVNVGDIDTVSTSLQAISTDLSFLRNIEGGRWKIITNQMVFFAEDNSTEVARFNLFDANGAPTETNVIERVRV